MSLLLLIRSGQRYWIFGPEESLEPFKKESYQKALSDLAAQLKQICEFERSPSLSTIAGSVLYYFDRYQGEISALNNYVKLLQDDLYEARNTPKDPQWVQNLKKERDSLANEIHELKVALDKERSVRRMENGQLEEQVVKLKAENQRLCVLLTWSGENKS